MLEIQNILKIWGVKGSIFLDLFPKRRPGSPSPPGYGPEHKIDIFTQNTNMNFIKGLIR